MKARVAERGQVTIPKVLRERLGIQPGTVLEFTENQGRLIAEKMENVNAVDQVYGCLGSCRHTDNIVKALRGVL
jgi:AbrB family looped-hinge helix DNA binding protein